MKLLMRAIVLVLVLITFSGLALGASSPRARLVSLSKEMPSLFSLEGGAQRQKIDSLVESYFDFDGFARLTIENYWSKTPKAKRELFLKLFRDRFLDNIYSRCQNKKLSDFKLEVLKISQHKAYTEVNVNIRSGDSSTDASLIWQRTGGVWRIVDITVSKANLIVNYSGRFSKMIDDHGFDYLLNKLKEEKKALQK